jgi:hypothetical protein
VLSIGHEIEGLQRSLALGLADRSDPPSGLPPEGGDMRDDPEVPSKKARAEAILRRLVPVVVQAASALIALWVMRNTDC